MNDTVQTDVLIIGAGPAGALLGNLLGRRGVKVVLAEKNTRTERSFRGETIAARSVVTLRELGFEPALARHGYVELEGISFWENGHRIMAADYNRFPIGALPIDIPQPALLEAFLDASRQLPSCEMLMGTNFMSLIVEDGVVRGAVLNGQGGRPVDVHARLVVGADGRFSRVRKASGLEVVITPMERDFVWFKFPRPDDWPHQSQLVVNGDKHLVILPTFPDLLRVGYNLPKKGFAKVRERGIEAFRASIVELDPRLAPLVEEHITGWHDTSFLDIFTAEMENWARDGLLLIGDAAHTSTPILGQGVNLALQDAVYLAPVLTAALARGGNDVVRAAELAAFVEKRRAHKAMVTKFQRVQEASLAKGSLLGTLLRRTRLRMLNLHPMKYRMLDRVMNAPHDMSVEANYARAA